MLEVVGALIQEGSRVLIARRPPGKSQALLWEFPGGKVEAGETPQASLVRELREELGIEVEVGTCFGVVEHAYGEQRIRLSCYHARRLAGTPVPLEGQTLAWAEVAQLERYEFAPADVPLVARLCGQAGCDRLSTDKADPNE